MQRLSENNADGHFISSLVKDRHFKFGKKEKLDYSKYLVGLSWKKVKLTRLSSTSIKNYGWYVCHFCKDINLTTDQIVEKYSRPGQFSYDFQKLVELFLFPIIEDVKIGMIEAQKANGAFSALKKFSVVNEITINWDHIRQFLPEINSNARDEAYTRQQIKDIIECGIDLRLQVAVLFMCSGGLRREAMTGLRSGDVEPLYVNNKLLAAKVIAYNEDKDRYITFVSPEAFRKYNKYVKTREKYGEVITKNSPVIIKKFDIKGDNATIDNHPIAPSTLDGLMIAVAVKAGVREPSPHYKNRYKNKACHAFRKTFESVLLNTITTDGDLVVNPLIAVQLLGDSVKAELGVGVMEWYKRKDPLQRNPSDPSNEYTSLLHEYKKAVWDLTISHEERLKEKNRELELKIENLNTVNTEINNIKREMEKQNQIVLDLAKKGVKLEPETNVSILSDMNLRDGSPVLVHTDSEGSIKNINVNAVQDTTHFENMIEEQQLKELKNKRQRAIVSVYNIDVG